LLELLSIVHADLGSEALIELDQELILSLDCPKCKTVTQFVQPISQVSFESVHCPTCGVLRETRMTHVITGEEDFLHRTLASLGVPPLHILRAYNLHEYRFYELTGDLEDALHFSDFEETAPADRESVRQRIRLGNPIKLKDIRANPAKDRIILHHKSEL
jgi:phage FluMu protein Com